MNAGSRMGRSRAKNSATRGRGWKEWAGKNGWRDRPFPFLVKFLFPGDKLSVQVHPGRRIRGEKRIGRWRRGKDGDVVRDFGAAWGGSARWIEARRDSRAISSRHCGRHGGGLRRKSSSAGGDAVFVPAGTVHTIGPGMVLCEIQENSDITYRVFDYNRRTAEGKPRELHVEKAFDVIRFGKQQGGKVALGQRKDGDDGISVLVDCPYFAVVKLAFAGPQRAAKPEGRMELVVVLEGRGTLRAERGDASVEYAPAQAWLCCRERRRIVTSNRKSRRLRCALEARRGNPERRGKFVKCQNART